MEDIFNEKALPRSSIRQLLPSEFPQKLLHIPDCPKRLWIEGILPTEDAIWLTIVGSRKYTSYGREITEELISGLRGLPIVIVSGLAIGIDAIAHQAAIKAGLLTVAIPGSGLDRTVLYPYTNQSLADDICRNGGALLSEFSPQNKATRWSFPARNRIMAGISDAVLIIEAGEKSGTLITARLALDYNRDVYAVPHNIWSETGRGCNNLIKQGAALIASPEHLRDALGFPSVTELIPSLPGLSPLELQILELLAEPMSKREIMSKIKAPVHQISISLHSLETAGIITETIGLIRRKF